MGYRACFHCELLFDVDDASDPDGVGCPQCGRALEPYVPEDEDELDPPEDSIIDLPTKVPGAALDAAIVKTMTVDGLADRVRERTARRQGSASVPGIDDTQEPDGRGLPPRGQPQKGPAPREPGQREPAPREPAPREPAPREPASKPLAPFGQRAPAAAPAAGSGGAGSGGGNHADLGARAGRTRVLPAVGDPAALADALDADQPPRPAPRAVAAPAVAPAGPRPTGPVPVAGAAGPRATGAVPRATGAVPPAPVPVGAEVPSGAAGRARGGAHAAVPRDDVPAAPGRKRRRWPWVLLVLALLGGGGAGGWWWYARRAPEAPPTPPPVVARSAPKTWSERIERQLADGQGKLAMVSGVSAAEEGGPFVAGGPEGLTTSAGPIHGMPRTEVGRTIIKADGEGEWVEPFVTTLEREKVEPTLTLSFAVDVAMTTADLLRLAYAGLKHGHQKFALVVARPEGTLGSLPFGLQPKGTRGDQGDAESQAVVRIGQLGFQVTINKAGEVVSTGDRLVPRRANSQALDLKGLGERLVELLSEHPDTRRVVVHPLGDLPTGALAEVLSAIRGADQSPRFVEVRLALP